jgi:biopolymer transport protein ExbD
MNKIHRREKPVAEINITPFTDVILVLLVIFMITTPLLSQAGFKVRLNKAAAAKMAPPLSQPGFNLPRASAAKPIGAPKQVSIVITSEGITYLENKPMTAKELKNRMSALYKSNPDISVVLYADNESSFRGVANVLDLLSGIGVTRLSIAAAKVE